MVLTKMKETAEAFLGTTVRQANLHSLKIFEGLGIGKGDTLELYKANKIIPVNQHI